MGLMLALCVVGSWGCVPRLSPAVPPGVALTPGKYLTAYYRAPDFTPAQAVYTLTTFSVATAQGTAGGPFQELFMQELDQAWRANGLKISPQGDTVVSGVIQFAAIRGTAIRFLTGKIDADLVVSGAITRGDTPLFAFQDRFSVSSPIKPGPPAPKEEELLLRLAARTFAGHLLNEMLLYWPPAEGR